MANYDIVVKGGKIIDGSGNPWFEADIGITRNKITKIGTIKSKDGSRIIDVSGLTVSPGFIDMHTHSDTSLLADGDAHSKIRQGVTLDIIGESQSVAPLAGIVTDEYKTGQMRRDGVAVDWSDFDGYFQ